jgi:hypothetical protein
MNDEAGSGSGMADDVRPDVSAPFASSGGLLRAAGQPQRGETDQIAVFIQQQPMTAALVALAVGYILGKIS